MNDKVKQGRAKLREFGRSYAVVTERPHNAKLLCGHTVRGYPVATLGGRGWYQCSVCDRLVKERVR